MGKKTIFFNLIEATKNKNKNTILMTIQFGFYFFFFVCIFWNAYSWCFFF